MAGPKGRGMARQNYSRINGSGEIGSTKMANEKASNNKTRAG